MDKKVFKTIKGIMDSKRSDVVSFDELWNEISREDSEIKSKD